MPAPAPTPKVRAWRLSWRDRALLWAPGVSLGLLGLLMWAALMGFALERPRQIRLDLQQEMAGAVRTAALQTDMVLRQAENAARVVDLWLSSRALERPEEDSALAALATDLHRNSGGMVDVVLSSAEGRVRPLRRPAGVIDGQVALAQSLPPVAAASPAAIRLGLPVRLKEAEAPSGWRLPLALPLTRPSGEFSLVLALVDLARLQAVQRQLARGTEPAMTLIREDDRVLSRVPEVPELVGRDLFARHPERRALYRDREGWLATDGSMTDGRARLGAYTTLPSFPLRLLMADTEEAALAPYQRQVGLLGTLALGATLALAALGLWLHRLQRATRLRDAALRATSNAVSIGLFRTQSDGRIVYVNEAYLRVHGMRREDIAWGWTQLVPPEQREALIATWKRHMATGEPIHMVRKMKRGDDGRIRILEVHTEPLIADGRVIGQAGTVEDVTERSEQEAAGRTLAAIFDMTPDFVCQIRENGDMVYLNPAGRARLGLAPDAPLAGVNIGRYYPRDRIAEYQEQILPTAIRQGHWQGRSAVLIGDGQELPIETTMLVHRDRRGRIEMISLLMRDVSEPLRAERERRRSEAMLLAVAQTTSALISVIDTAQRLIFVNAAYEVHRGVARDDCLGRPLSEVLSPVDYEQRRDGIQAALRGESMHLELAVPDERDPQRYELQLAPLRVQDGGIEGVICIELDVTEARREEARLRRASETDALTQLPNRAGFEERGQALLDQARTEANRVAVLYLDLDRFKPVNDTHGHATGDALLKAVALRLRHALRPGDLVARLGGDEFAVLLAPSPTESEVGAVAGKLVRSLSSPFHIGELVLDVGVSIGYCIGAADGLTLDTLLVEADRRLYEAKRAGRGCWRGAVFSRSGEQ